MKVVVQRRPRQVERTLRLGLLLLSLCRRPLQASGFGSLFLRLLFGNYVLPGAKCRGSPGKGVEPLSTLTLIMQFVKLDPWTKVSRYPITINVGE